MGKAGPFIQPCKFKNSGLMAPETFLTSTSKIPYIILSFLSLSLDFLLTKPSPTP